MNWTQFLLSLLAIYFIYYLLNVLFDLIRSKQTFLKDTEQEELVFSEAHSPEVVGADELTPDDVQLKQQNPNSRQAISSGPLETTGGVSLKRLFSLAQSDLIEYTKAIPY